MTPLNGGGRLQSAMDAESEKLIIGRVLKGNLEAYGEIVSRYQDRLYWVAYRLLGNREDARDVTQEAFLRAYRRLSTFDRERRFYTWIYRILTNLAIDHLRRRRRDRPAPLAEDVAAEGFDPDAHLLSEELREQVWSTLDRLPGHYRAILVLRDVEGLSGKEISERTGAGHATTRWRIHRARVLFREAWERVIGRREP